jgi:hypothetical protein
MQTFPQIHNQIQQKTVTKKAKQGKDRARMIICSIHRLGVPGRGVTSIIVNIDTGSALKVYNTPFD